MTIDAYIYLMVAVLLTIFCIVAGVFAMFLIWNSVVLSIVDDIQSRRDNFWKKCYDDECKNRQYWEGLFHKFRINHIMAEHIYSATTERREDLNENGRLEVRILLEVIPEEKNE